MLWSVGHVLINQWWKERSGYKKQKDAARFLGLTPPFFNMILKGKRTPGREGAVAIQERTGISVATWSLPAVDKSQKPAKRRTKKGAGLHGVSAT